MDWLSLQIDQLEPSFIRPHPVALVAALAFGLFWLRAGPRVLPGRPGAWFGLVIGAAAYVPVLLWVQGEPTRAALAIIRDNVGPGELAGARPLVGVVEALIAGYAAEIVKLLLMLLVLFAMGYPRDSAAATTAGLAPAAGFALFGAQLELTRAFEGAPVAGVLAFPVIEQAAWVALNFGAGYLLATGWRTGRLGTYVIYAGLLHAAGAYTIALDAIGWHPVVVTLLLAVIALLTFTGGASTIASRR